MKQPKNAQCNDTDFRVLKYIHEFQEQYRNSPTAGLISAHLSLSSSSVYYCLGKLQKAGYIDWIQVPPSRVRFIVPLYRK